MGKYKDFVGCGMLKRTPLFTQFERDINGSKTLDNKEIVDRIRRMRDTSNEALKTKLRQEIIMANLGLIIGISKTFSYNDNIETMDIINEGIIGLSDAIDKFDVSNEKCKFSSYAALHISNAIRVFVYDMAGACRRSNEWKRRIAYQKARRKLDSEKYGDYTEEELLDEINKNMSSGHKSRNLAAFLPMISQKIREEVVLYSAKEACATSPEYVTNEEECLYSVNVAMSAVKDQAEGDIIRHLFGLDGYKKLEYDELANKLGMTVWGLKNKVRKILGNMREALAKAGIDQGSLNFGNYDEYTSEIRGQWYSGPRVKYGEE